MKLFSFKLRSTWLTLSLALFFVLFSNFTLVQSLYHIFSNESQNIFFILSIPLFFLALFNLFLNFLSFPYLTKPFFIFLILTSAIANYAMYYYQVVFDSNMMANIFETNIAESTTYFNLSFLSWFTLLGLIPALIVARIKIVYSGVFRELVYKVLSILSSVLMIALILLFFFKDYASVARNNSDLKYKINPNYFVASTYKYIKLTYFSKPVVYKYLGTDASKIYPNQKNVLVFIVGETARAQNYQLNGYDRETNFYSKDIKNLVYFKHVFSCGTATATSVPCMFSTLKREEYSRNKFDNQDNIVDILKYAGTKMLWLDNNTGCKGVCKNIESIQFSASLYPKYCDSFVCTDDIFLAGLDSRIKKMARKGGIIFMHIMGSHGPTYYKRSPKSFKRFFPECSRSDIQNCTNQEIVNTYDNSILYTDYIMSQIIEHLKKAEDNLKISTALMYISDHGESLGENGLFLHGFPYALAPEAQIHVPMIVWLSKTKLKDDHINFDCLVNRANQETFSQDNISYTLLGLMNIKTKIYKENLDLLAPCKK